MPRTATPRPPAEHLSLITRIANQVGADRVMQPARRRKVQKHLTAALVELQKEALRR